MVHPTILPNESIHAHRRQLKRPDRPMTKIETENKSIEFKLNSNYPINETKLKQQAIAYLKQKNDKLQQRNESISVTKSQKRSNVDDNNKSDTTVRSSKKMEID